MYEYVQWCGNPLVGMYFQGFESTFNRIKIFEDAFRSEEVPEIVFFKSAPWAGSLINELKRSSKFELSWIVRLMKKLLRLAQNVLA
jgi:hypothetical protein